MKAQVIAKIAKDWGEETANKMVELYWNLSELRGCKTVSQFAKDIVGFYFACL